MTDCWTFKAIVKERVTKTCTFVDLDVIDLGMVLSGPHYSVDCIVDVTSLLLMRLSLSVNTFCRVCSPYSSIYILPLTYSLQL